MSETAAAWAPANWERTAEELAAMAAARGILDDAPGLLRWLDGLQAEMWEHVDCSGWIGAARDLAKLKVQVIGMGSTRIVVPIDCRSGPRLVAKVAWNPIGAQYNFEEAILSLAIDWPRLRLVSPTWLISRGGVTIQPRAAMIAEPANPEMIIDAWESAMVGSPASWLHGKPSWQRDLPEVAKRCGATINKIRGELCGREPHESDDRGEQARLLRLNNYGVLFGRPVGAITTPRLTAWRQTSALTRRRRLRGSSTSSKARATFGSTATPFAPSYRERMTVRRPLIPSPRSQ
jgi:hypothetical protein